MDDAQVGWIAAIVIGGVAGWLAEQFMKSEMGTPDEYRARCHRGGGCQRHFELLWGPPRGMDRLPDSRVCRGGLADLDRAGGTRDTSDSLRPTNRPRRQVRTIPHLGRCGPIELSDRRSDLLGLRGRLGWRPLSFQTKRAMSAIGT